MINKKQRYKIDILERNRYTSILWGRIRIRAIFSKDGQQFKEINIQYTYLYRCKRSILDRDKIKYYKLKNGVKTLIKKSKW